MVFYPPSHPPTREGNWSHCSEYLSCLDRGVDFIALDWTSWSREVGGGLARKLLGVDGPKIFNRSPITLKFGAPNLERESQERESESESESESEREQVVVFTFASCCCFTLVS